MLLKIFSINILMIINNLISSKTRNDAESLSSCLLLILQYGVDGVDHWNLCIEHMPCCPSLLQSWDWITLSLTLMCLEKGSVKGSVPAHMHREAVNKVCN